MYNHCREIHYTFIQNFSSLQYKFITTAIIIKPSDKQSIPKALLASPVSQIYKSISGFKKSFDKPVERVFQLRIIWRGAIMFIINCELICPRFPNRRIIHKSDLEEIPKTCLDIEIHSILSPYLVWSQSILHNQDLVYSYSNRNTKPFLPYPFEILLSFLFPSIFLCDHQSKGRDYLFLRFLYFYSFIHSHSLSLLSK